MVPEVFIVRLELTRPFDHKALNLARLPNYARRTWTDLQTTRPLSLRQGVLIIDGDY